MQHAPETAPPVEPTLMPPPRALRRERMTLYYGAWHYLLRAVVPTLAYVKVEGVEHIPRTGGALLVANHLSMADPPLLMAYVPRHIHWMVKAEAFEQWPLGVLMPPGDPIKVHRGKVDRTALRAAETYLRAGAMIGIFAEGHRSEAGQAQQARAGAVYLAQRTDALLVPTAISGTERIFSKRFPWYRRGSVRLRFGPAFRLSELPAAQVSKPDRDRLAFEVMARVAALLPPAYRGIYKEDNLSGT